MEGEEVNESVGVKHDQGKPQLGLISGIFLMGLGKVLTFGARKYTQYGDCSCHVKCVNELKSKLEGFVKATMTSGSVRRTLDILSANEPIRESGTRKTEKSFSSIIELGHRKSKQTQYSGNDEGSKRFSEIMELLRSNLHPYLQDPVISAEVIRIYESTIATVPEKSGADYVTHATFILDGLKKSHGLNAHSAICKTHQVVSSGVHNWRKGIAYSRLFDALMRHLWAWWGGEETDPESGESHLDHAACCLMFLRELKEMRQDLDDRYKLLEEHEKRHDLSVQEYVVGRKVAENFCPPGESC